jgi:ABC-type proline/glycine betaine transport system permease subunit
VGFPAGGVKPRCDCFGDWQYLNNLKTRPARNSTEKDSKMHHSYVDRGFLQAILALLILLCISFTTQTPTTLVFFAGLMVVIGSLGWFYSRDLPSTWTVRLGSTAMIVLGIAFLIWYAYRGHTLLRPILDVEEMFKSIQSTLATTPTPKR